MKLLEYEAKRIFETAGIPVPRTGGVITKAAQLPAALRRAGKGPWVLKAQVLAGGRGKAGGVKLVKTPAEAREAAKAMLGMKIATHQTHGSALSVREVLVDQASKIAREIYLSVVLDRREACPVVIASAEGGMQIEELAKSRPEAILRERVDSVRGMEPFQARRLAFRLGVPVSELGSFVRLVSALVRLFVDLDASLVEVNPLILTAEGRLLAIDGKIVVDDNALFRHKELSARKDPEATALEREAKKVGINYIGLDGNIGCMVNGAGLAMGTMDTVALAGGTPANFLDVGGGATAEQVAAAFRIILKDPKVRTILINIFGGIMRCDVIAQGVLEAVKKVKLSVPLVVRLEGTNVAEGRELLRRSGLRMEQAESLWDAAQKAVSAAAR
ncbi:MAG TPA: ADP-forming succinate--CoA ligase subunit beta [Elusimicrobia bacterium]|nr:ADP-forming succinate--CoA ligase subunit beta [Elusimicrobiota bacterium]